MEEGASSREAAKISIAASSMFPGFRFSPTDEELISYYLKNKMCEPHRNVEVIPELEIWRYEPWDLPAKSIIPSENEWFFFSPRGRKYPNGSQSRRATESGYWKATGKERNVKSGSGYIGTKRTLVFHVGRAPKGERTEWIMHEYCMLDKSQDYMVVCRLRRNTDFCLNDSSNRASSSQRPLSTVQNNNDNNNNNNNNNSHGGSEAGTEQAEKAAECNSSKKSCSSYDSYSIEQNDSASESNQKLPLEVTQPQCSGHGKDYGDEDDFFAEILKDDIIKLDEPSISSARDISPLGSFGGPEDEHKSQQPTEPVVGPRGGPVQGTANRRILLKKDFARTDPTRIINVAKRRNSCPKSEEKAKLPKSFKGHPSVISVSRYRVTAAMMVLAFTALCVSLFGGFSKLGLCSSLCAKVMCVKM